MTVSQHARRGSWNVLLLLWIAMPGMAQSSAADPPSQVSANANRQMDAWGPIIDAASLQQALTSESIAIFDLGPQRKVFDKGHITGALFIDWVTDITDPKQLDRYNVIDRGSLESLLQRLGIRSTTRIVLYDDALNRMSARMYWTLKYYGHPAVHILDGGRSAWLRNGFPMTEVQQPTERSNYKLAPANPAYAADADFIRRHLTDPQVVLIDGRPAVQYSGQQPGKVYHTGIAHKQRGHIPGAISIFWEDNFNRDGTFKSLDALQQLYAEKKVSPNQTVITYCNEGLHAAPPWFVLRELLHFKDVRLYDDSMAQWANTNQPMATSATPVTE